MWWSPQFASVCLCRRRSGRLFRVGAGSTTLEGFSSHSQAFQALSSTFSFKQTFSRRRRVERDVVENKGDTSARGKVRSRLEEGKRDEDM